MSAFEAFGSVNTWNLHDVNGALLTLLSKSDEVASVKRLLTYRTHPLGKFLLKVLANRLASKLPGLVHPCRSAFIKGRKVYSAQFQVCTCFG
jgi:hypothetical protein